MILRPITSVLIFWVKIVHGIFYRVVNSIKDTDRVSNDDKDDLLQLMVDIQRRKEDLKVLEKEWHMV